MEQTFRQRLTKERIASTLEWRQENGVEVRAKDDPNNEHDVIEITIITTDDYLIGQLINKLGLSLEERRERPRRTWRRFWRKKPRS